MPQIDGIVSGYDTSSMIDAILSAYTTPEKVTANKLTDAEDKLDTVKEFKDRLDTLGETIEAMSSEEDFISYAATTSVDDYLTVEVDSDARPGTYDVTVDTLSSTETEASNGFEDATSTGVIQAGDLIVTYGGVDHTVTLVDGDNNSLEGLADEINDIEGLQAFVIDTGDTFDPYKLVVIGEDTGESNTIEFDTSGLTGAGTTVPTFTEEESASSAQITINGVTVKSDTDTFKDVVPGVTIDATQLSSGAETRINVSLDDTTMEEKVQAFVDAYNNVLGYWESQTVYNPDLNMKGGLVGDTTVRRIVNQLTSDIGARLASNTSLTNLSSVGISTKESGKLDFDTSEFSDGFDVDFDELIALFTDENGPIKTIGTALSEVYLADDGTMKSRIDTLEAQVTDLEDQLDEWAERKTAMEERLRSQFTAMEIALSNIQSNGSFVSLLATPQIGASVSSS